MDNFIHDRSPLRAADAVAAIIVVGQGSYLMQRRDDKPGIFYPNHWGLFGGAIEPDEDALEALRRELREELYLSISEARYFMALEFDLTTLGAGRVSRLLYEVHIKAEDVGSLVLGEGAALEVIEADDLLRRRRVTPYDSFAIWLHFARERLSR